MTQNLVMVLDAFHYENCVMHAIGKKTVPEQIRIGKIRIGKIRNGKNVSENP